jgi:acyl dehydratase
MAEIGKHARGLPGLPQAHAEIPVWNAENWYFEDFTPGDRIRSIRRTISEGEAMLFNSLVMDHHPYVSDQPFAEREGAFGRRLVAGAMVFSYGYDRLRFIAPVFIGDTIYTIRENLSKDIHDLKQGKVRVSYSVYKDEGTLVLYAEHLMTALYRDPGRFRVEAETRLAQKAAATSPAHEEAND